MKIVIAHNSYQRPGGEDVVARQERQLLENEGHTVVSYLRSNWEVASYGPLQQIALVPKTVWSSDAKKEFAHLLRVEKPDLVHVHNTLLMISPSIFSACQEAGIPVVHTLHNYRILCPGATFFRDGQICEECTQHTLWRSVQHGCYRNSRAATATIALMIAVNRGLGTWDQNVDGLIALTQFARSKFLAQGVPSEKLFVKPNFVDPDPMPGNSDGEYVIFAGRLTPEKRISTVLLAMRRLSDKIPLMVVGGGPQRVQLENEARHHGLKNVIFRGQLSREDTVSAMKGARFLIFSSEWYETFGMTIIESFACGVPVICSRLGAMRELVDDGRTGLHFTPGDHEDLAEKLNWAWHNPAVTRDLGREARREYEGKYTAQKNYPLLMDIYKRTIGASA
jgi:glycosyltransferase involved in cell wall biosynthesis